MSSVSENAVSADSTDNLQLKTFKNQPKSSNEMTETKEPHVKRKSLQSLISIEPEPISSNQNDSVLAAEGIIQPEPNFLPMINSLLESDMEHTGQSLFLSNIDSVDRTSTINRLFFQDESSNKVLAFLLKLRHQINSINVSNSRNLYGNVSVIHVVAFAILATLNFLYFRYARGKMMQKSKLIATIVANALLNGVSDTIAQLISSSAHTKAPPTLPANFSDINTSFSGVSEPIRAQNENETLALEDLEYQPSLLENESIYTTELIKNTSSYDFQLWRLICFSMWGAFMANFQVPWYFILNKLFTEDPSIVQTLERILSDQLFYSPISLYFFFAFANYVMEAGNVFTFRTKLKKIYLNTLVINYLLWPLMQFVNFSFISKDDQPLFSSCISVVWNVILSIRNASTN